MTIEEQGLLLFEVCILDASQYRVVHHLVALIEQQTLGDDGILAFAPGHDGDAVAGVDKMGGSAVDNDLSRAARAGDDVGFQACAVGDGGHQHFFAHPEVGFFHEIGRNGDAAFIGDVGIGDGGTVEFGFEAGSKHLPECVIRAGGQVLAALNGLV